MQIKPITGRLVRDPVTGREITGPTTVPDNDAFWLRRVADGDVTVSDSSDISEAKPTKKGAE